MEIKGEKAAKLFYYSELHEPCPALVYPLPGHKKSYEYSQGEQRKKGTFF